MNGSLELLFFLSGFILTIGYVNTFTPPKLGDTIIKNIDINEISLNNLDNNNILSHNETQGICKPYSDPETNIYDIKLILVKHNILKILENDNYPIQSKLDLINSYDDIIFENQNTDSSLFDDWNFDLF